MRFAKHGLDALQRIDCSDPLGLPRNISRGALLDTFNSEISVQMSTVKSVLAQSAHRTSPPPALHSRPKQSDACLKGSGELILIRGFPGSGKSTMAKVLALVGFEHFEADMFFEQDGKYHYDASRIRDAHSWCQLMTRQALVKRKKVVVSNTFTQLRELEPYRLMTEKVRVIEARGTWQNQHGVPVEMMERMAQRWEQLPDALLAA
jgi:DNA polymerase III delta prime subunit